jgi:stress responsive alpha/beta barrel protein
MRYFAMIALLVVVAAISGDVRSSTQAVKEPQIAHMVYFQLNDNSEAKIKELVAACDKLLNDHPGTVYYSAGSLAKEFKRDVNDRDWDVALHLVFKTKADHDRYQDHPRHKQFIAEQKSNMKKVRVFDAAVTGK